MFCRRKTICWNSSVVRWTDKSRAHSSWPDWQVSGVSRVQVSCISQASSLQVVWDPAPPQPLLKGRVRPRDDIWPLQWPSRAASVISHNPRSHFHLRVSPKLQERTVEASCCHQTGVQSVSAQWICDRNQTVKYARCLCLWRLKLHCVVWGNFHRKSFNAKQTKLANSLRFHAWINWINKLTLKDNTVSCCFILCLYVADRATFLASNSKQLVCSVIEKDKYLLCIRTLLVLYILEIWVLISSFLNCF